MLSKSKQKFITSLQVKKCRLQEQKFIVEGAKSVLELLLSPLKIDWIGCSHEFYMKNHKDITAFDYTVLSAEELTKISSFKTNEEALAIVCFPPKTTPRLEKEEWIIALDDIRDPGNLGTIIRTAHWYGIKEIIASEETADIYNPKTIAATMGSFCHIHFHYCSLPNFLASTALRIYGACMEGTSVHTTTFPKGGALVIGNESHGISALVKPFIKERITIPRIGSAESLNAAIATAIILDNIFKK